MATYNPPEQWNREAAESAKEAKRLRKMVEDSSSPSSRIMQTFGHLRGKKQAEAESAAIRHLENIRESEAEALEQRAADQYPKGTSLKFSDDRPAVKSRNRAGYGKKPDIPEGYAKGGKVRGWGKARGGKQAKIY